MKMQDATVSMHPLIRNDPNKIFEIPTITPEDILIMEKTALPISFLLAKSYWEKNTKKLETK